ncbi:hypothetical protein ACFQ51_55540 [Streptomyces kaempferi]
MPSDVLHQALGQLRDDLDLTRLGAVPRLGLACVGRWSRELGFNVELGGSSAYGGTRAVMFVPFRLLTEPLPRPAAHRHPAIEPAEHVGPVVTLAGVRDDTPVPAGHTDDAPEPPTHPPRRRPVCPGGAAGAVPPGPRPHHGTRRPTR